MFHIFARVPSIRLKQAVTAVCVAALLAGCASTKPAADAHAKKTPEEKAAAAKENAQIKGLIDDDPIAAAAYWGSIYDSDHKNADAAASYGDALRKIGSLEKALSVLKEAATANPQQAKVLASYGKTLIVAGQPADAAPVLLRACNLAPKDASIHAAAGVALDQAGDHDQAATHFEKAVELAPKDPAILNNFAVSKLLSGKPAEAENLLRKAVLLPNAAPQVRQNLAIALSLQGRYDEAKTFASNDLLPKDAQNNIDYIRELTGAQAAQEQGPAPLH